jgi:hypothetical protein
VVHSLSIPFAVSSKSEGVAVTEKLPETVAEIAAFYRARDFNNFYLNLPGSILRDRAVSPSEIKLYEDLDREAARLGIDTKVIFELMIQRSKKLKDALPIMRALGYSLDALENPEIKRLSDEADALEQEAHKRMIPLFDALVALGYHPTELVR